MMKVATLCSLPMLALAGISFSQKQSGGNLETTSWVCGNKADTNAFNPLAGVVTLQSGSLDYIRSNSTETASMTAAQLARVQQTSFSDLFCYDYIKAYQNPNSATNTAGVCIRDITVGNKWLTILDTDDEVRSVWEMFGTKYGYQKSVAKWREQDQDGNVVWGSGHTGPNPSNWCAAYMRDMMCHVAFPQFADADTKLAAENGTGLGAAVRPVCSDDCKDLMDVCNRHEPDPYTNVEVSWLKGYETENEDMDNELYCKAWNKGYHLARAGTGVADGDDDNSDTYCAQFDSAATAAPMMVLAVIASLVVLF